MFARRTRIEPEQLEHWDQRGFLVLPGFFAPDRVEAINDLVERAWVERRDPANPLVVDAIGGPLDGQRMHFRDAPDAVKDHPYKLNDLYLVSRQVRELVTDRGLIDVLQALIGGHEVAICNSLNFERGSQQDHHFDTYYMPGPCPDGLIVTSICLEDVHPDAGPLTYYPGSHRIPPYRFSHGELHAVPEEMDEATEYARRHVRERGLEEERFLGRAGDVFVWHEQLYHGGSPIADQARTRRSLVTHYWRSDVLTVPEGWHLEGRRNGRWLARGHQPVPTSA
jgi:phytanoyl-CoA hydroxylase